LLAYAAQFPELCQQTDDDEQGGLRFEIDKSRISIRLTHPTPMIAARQQVSWQRREESITTKVAPCMSSLSCRGKPEALHQ
jgi:hypothetical protein